MKEKRVLITTYQSAFLKPGGGEAELLSLVDVLGQAGISADIYGSTSLNIEAYEVVLHFSVHGEGYEFVKSLKNMGKKIILWPNLWWLRSPLDSDVVFVSRFLKLADVVVFKSTAELNNIAGYIPLNDIKHEIIPWHIDASFLSPVSTELFKNLYNLDQFILWVGVIERSKNQLAAIEALNEFSIPLVFIGYHRDEEYFEESRSLASENILFLPYMKSGSEILRSAIKGCSAYIELSPDPAGLSLIEAAYYERPLVALKNDWSIESFGDDAVLIDDVKRISVIDGVNKALDISGPKPCKDNILSKHLMLDSLNPLVEVINVHKSSWG